MRNDLTDIVFLLDRTGSMASMASDVLGGLNSFVEDQQKVPGEATFTLIQFDSQNPYEVLIDAKPIGEVPKITTFVPRASTPLYDALGRTIVNAGERLAKLPEDQRPGKVLVVVFTDGEENASREYSGDKIREMVKHQEEAYKWQFIFMGAGIDAIAGAKDVAVPTANALGLARSQGLRAMNLTSHKVAEYRLCGVPEALNYTDEERQEVS